MGGVTTTTTVAVTGTTGRLGQPDDIKGLVAYMRENGPLDKIRQTKSNSEFFDMMRRGGGS